jgi:hypothetical protein
MNNVLMTIRVITTPKGWMIDQNDNFIVDDEGNNCWDDLSDALAALRSGLEVLDFDK